MSEEMVFEKLGITDDFLQLSLREAFAAIPGYVQSHPGLLSSACRLVNVNDVVYSC
jgi:hypothetical protein